MPNKRYVLPSKESVRKLRQYAKMTDEEFDEFWAKKVMDVAPSQQLENRIELELKKYEVDYDLSDLKINDKTVLRALVQAQIQLEDLEQALYKTRENGVTTDNIALLGRMNDVMSQLRKDISQMQEDLRITRKARKGDKEQTVIAYLDDLKVKAKKFYESTMFYGFCPECNQLLGTFWFHYPEGTNHLLLHCGRMKENGEKCKGELKITSKMLLELKGTSKADVPESMF